VNARLNSYIQYADNIELAHVDVAQVINACVAGPGSTWQLPYCQRGTAAWGLYANDCRARHTPSLFFVERHFACKWLEENSSETMQNHSVFIGPQDHGPREVGNSLHELVRRHAWCQDPPPPCTDAETREHPNWCLPEPTECMQAQLRSIDWLLERGVDINQFEHGDMTVLHYAALTGNYLVVQDLLNRGANPNIAAKTESAITAIEEARKRIEGYFNGHPSPAAQRTLELLQGQQNLPE
jgi:ankyrin repeat protein